ncbi:MFS transporter [Rosenbergiella sp. S61]|uniref:MFS transporter n=1 Tax=Rosenbergiella gaditana TaxID=2726987 RepID=A0ABS5SSX7_9GAMM|nr:MFS transporter [Rosenbergiella gaditana]MBT0723144.1 MFS transporter [Rosenbergiella gaditana]
MLCLSSLLSVCLAWSQVVNPVASSLSPFSHRGFRHYLIAQTCSSLGFQIVSLAVSWQIYAMTHSAFMLGMIGLMQFLPSILLALPAGHLADQYNRKTLIVTGQVIEFLAVAGLIALPFFSWLSTPALLGLVALFWIAKAVEGPANTSLLPALLPAELLSKAMATNQVFREAMVIAGPMIGGLLYLYSPEAAYGVAAICYFVALLMIATVHYPPVALTRLPMTMKNLFAGLHFIFERKDILGVISLDLFAVLLGGVTALLPIFAQDILHTGPWGLGALRAAPSVGALLTGIWISRRVLTRHTGLIMFGCVAGFGVATLVFALSHNLVLSLLALVALGGFDMVSMVIRGAMVQLDTPDAMRGRVNAVNSIFINTSNQFGEFETGVLASMLGTVPAAVVGGVGTLVVVAIWMKLFPSLRQRQQLT